jgi:hypothetical protein
MRFWTVDEARAYLPRLRELLTALQAAQRAVALARTNGHGATGPSASEALAELEAGDIVLRDPAVGLIDFHAQGADGVVYLLCWRADEEELEWWHLPEEGFAGRKRLPRVDP